MRFESARKARAQEQTPTEEKGPEGSLVDMEVLKGIIGATLEGRPRRAKLQTIEITQTSSGIFFSATLASEGFFGGEISAAGMLINTPSGGITVDMPEVTGRGRIKEIEEHLSTLQGALTKELQLQSRDPKARLKISPEGNLTIVSETPLTASPDLKEGVPVEGPDTVPHPPAEDAANAGAEATETKVPLPPENVPTETNALVRVPSQLPPEEQNLVTTNEGAPKKKKQRVAIIDTSGALEEQARDMADERMTASKAELKGFKGVFQKIWKHNLAREYYRQKEIALAKKDIVASGNLYVGEGAEQSAHTEAMNAVIDRFIQEYEDEDIIHAGEKRTIETDTNSTLNTEVRALIREYASGSIDDASFTEERHRIIAAATGLSGEQLQQAVNHTDSICEIAQNAKNAVEHGARIEDIDTEIELVIGKAKLGVRTEAQHTVGDRIAEKIQSTKLGSLVNETTIASGVAIAYAVGVRLSQSAARSRVLAWGTLGLSAAYGGVIAGARENRKVKDERRQHARERAKGKEMDPDMKRRTQMEQAIYKTVSAVSLTESIKSLSSEVNTQEEFYAALNALSEARSRILLSDTEHIDLLAYSDFKSVEQERMALDIACAEAKVALRQKVTDGTITLPPGTSFDTFVASTVTEQTRQLREDGDESMEKKDEIFKKMKNRRVGRTVGIAVLSGLTIGALGQEASAFVSNEKVGLLEHAIGMDNNPNPQSLTALEGLRGWWKGDRTPAMATLHTPQGPTVTYTAGKIDMVATPGAPEHTFTVFKNSAPVTDVHFGTDGRLLQESRDMLKARGMEVTEVMKSITATESVTVTSQEFTEAHPELFQKIHRTWYDNKTSIADKNELKLQWGGEKGTGIDPQGGYAFDIHRMATGGSSARGALSPNIQNELKAGKLKLLLSLSRNTQSHVVEVPITADGKISINPDSEIGKMFFSKGADGKVEFKGKFAEIGQVVGKMPDGTARFAVLATHSGSGIPQLATEVPVSRSTTITNITERPTTIPEVLDPVPPAPASADVLPPAFIPVMGRTPLERVRNPRRRAEAEPTPPPPPENNSGQTEKTEEIKATGQKETEKLQLNIDHWEKLDPYAVLGLRKDATSAEAHKAWRLLRKKYHPDGEQDPEVAKQKTAISRIINDAYAKMQQARGWKPAKTSAQARKNQQV